MIIPFEGLCEPIINRPRQRDIVDLVITIMFAQQGGAKMSVLGIMEEASLIYIWL